MSLGRPTLVLILITVGVKILGFVEKQVIAYYFGADARVDAFFVAVSVPTVLFLLVREIIEPAYLPLFVRQVEEGRNERGGKLFAAVGMLVIGVLVPLAIAGGVGATALAGWLAPGFEPAVLELTARLIRWTIAAGALLGLSALTYTTLNAQRRFALPASGDLVLKVAPILCALLFAPRLGVMALALGMLLGALGRLLVHLFGLRRDLLLLAWPLPEMNRELRQLGLLMAPLVLAVLFSQVSELADNFFASQLGDGAVAARTFARRIVDLPVLILPYTLSVVAFPTFASLASRREEDRLYELLGNILRGLVQLFAFLAVATVFLAEPIVALLLERGAFDATARQLTAWPLRLYGLGLVTFAVEALLVPFYYALGDTRTPALLGMLGVTINIGLTAVLIGPLGVGGVAAALTCSKSIKVLLLGVLLRCKRRQLPWAPVLGAALRLASTTATAAVAMYFLGLFFEWPGSAAGVLSQLVYLTAMSMAGLVVFVVAVLAFRSPERTLLIAGWRTAIRLVIPLHDHPPS
jgi:murein biosynthesis integral membrane protein MurJ